MCAANQDENRHTAKDQLYAGNNSSGGASRIPETNDKVAGKIATLSEMADAIWIPLHSPSPSSILLIIRKIPEFARRLLIFQG